jgi:4-amino-4-deoxy-L-arabinose transferase-like glycosyltransferase
VLDRARFPLEKGVRIDMGEKTRENGRDPNSRDIVILFIFALVVRLSVFPYWKDLHLYGDEFFYWSWAQKIADGNFLRNFLRPPLWTYILSIPALLTDNYVYGRALTVVLSSFSVPLIYSIGKYIFNRKAGIIAGTTYSVYPNIVGYSHYLWSETLLALFILVSTFLFFKAAGNEKKHILVYLSFAVSSIGLLTKEFAIIQFGALILALIATELIDKKKMILMGTVIFLTPILIYSAIASVYAQRPVILADAFVYNSNEADSGKIIWKKTTKENLEIFTQRLFKFREIPARFVRQVYNLWTPNSFPVFRLLNADQKYKDIPHPQLVAYITSAMYILVVVFGLTGMCCAEKNLFLVFSISNLLLLSSAGLFFLMCSRFRIPFMYIFILYSSALLADPKAALKRMTWQRGLLIGAIGIVFIKIIINKAPSFGYWG